MALVGNDAAWTQILREQVTILGTEVACKLAVSDFHFLKVIQSANISILFGLFQHTDYHVVAQGYGGIGYQLTREDKDKLADLLQKARRESHDTGKSVLVNALIGKTGFRDGSISV